MDLPQPSDIEDLTYNSRDLPKGMLYLDQLLDRFPMANIEYRTESSSNLGTLSILPTELLLQVFRYLSIQDLIRFRRCNQCAIYTTNGISHLQTILQHARSTVQGILAIQSPAISVGSLYSKLCQKTCDGCIEIKDDFCNPLAPYLYLPTYKRYCLPCFGWTGADAMGPSCPLSQFFAMEGYGLDLDTLSTIPSFRFLPSTFTNGFNAVKYEGTMIYYDEDEVESKSEEMYGVTKWEQIRQKMSEEEIYDHLWGSTWLEWPDKDKPRFIVSQFEEQPVRQVRQHMAGIYAPWLVPGRESSQEARFCRTCLYTRRTNEAYTDETFYRHLQGCKSQRRYESECNNRKMIGNQIFVVDEEEIKKRFEQTHRRIGRRKVLW